MLALVDQWRDDTPSEELEDPALQDDTDAIVRVDAMTLSDEAIGTVEAVGTCVRTIEIGDRVLVASAPAERVRVPLADAAVCKVPEGATDGELLMLATFFRRATPSLAATRAR